MSPRKWLGLRMADGIDRGDIQAIVRAASVLRLVCRLQAISVNDVSEALSLERTTAHRYLRTLKKVGLLKNDAAGEHRGRYQLGPLAATLADAISSGISVYANAKAELPTFADELGCTAVLSLVAGFPITVTEVAYPKGDRLAVRIPLGYHVPLDGAQSIIALAFLPDAEAVLADVPEPTRTRLRELAEAARATGVHQTTAQGMPVCAVPLLQDGRLVSTIAAVAEPGSTRPPEQTRAALVALAARLST